MRPNRRPGQLTTGIRTDSRLPGRPVDTRGRFLTDVTLHSHTQRRGVVKGIAQHGNLVGPDAEYEYTELLKRSHPAGTR